MRGASGECACGPPAPQPAPSRGRGRLGCDLALALRRPEGPGEGIGQVAGLDEAGRQDLVQARPLLPDIGAWRPVEQIVELTLTICVANFTNRVNDTLLCDPDLG